MNTIKPEVTIELQKRDAFRRHQRQSFWQIILPVILAGLLMLTGMVVMILSISGAKTGIVVSQWSDLSVIWLTLPMFIPAVMVLIFTILIIYGVARLIKLVPKYAQLIQAYVKLYALRINLATNKAAAPFIGWKSILAGAGRIFSSLFGR
jgi:FtsH-binding integral membrane protein